MRMLAFKMNYVLDKQINHFLLWLIDVYRLPLLLSLPRSPNVSPVLGDIGKFVIANRNTIHLAKILPAVVPVLWFSLMQCKDI